MAKPTKSSYIRKQQSGLAFMHLKLLTLEGHPAMLIENCVVSLGSGIIRLNQQPMIFKLANIRNARDPSRPCLNGSFTYGGAVRLAVNAAGDIKIDVNWNMYDRDGQPIDNYSLSDFVVPNLMTPLMAQREVDRSEVAAREQHEQEAKEEREIADKKRTALAGNLDAMIWLGSLYENRNGAEAVRWYAMAVAKGSGSAMFRMGRLYSSGSGDLAQSDAMALRYYKMAALAGVPEGAYNTGIMYKTGRGVAPSLSEARKWMKMAAEKGDDDAIEWLKATTFAD